MWRRFKKATVIILLSHLVMFASCSGSKDYALASGNRKAIAGTPAPGWVWEPEYYIFDGKDYRFVKGHYRLVLFRKAYYKRKLRGHSSKYDHTAAR
jgi:hypothetical protein